MWKKWRDEAIIRRRWHLRHRWRHHHWRHRRHGGLTPAAVAEAPVLHHRTPLTVIRRPLIGCRLSMTTHVTIQTSYHNKLLSVKQLVIHTLSNKYIKKIFCCIVMFLHIDLFSFQWLQVCLTKFSSVLLITAQTVTRVCRYGTNIAFSIFLNLFLRYFDGISFDACWLGAWVTGRASGL